MGDISLHGFLRAIQPVMERENYVRFQIWFAVEGTETRLHKFLIHHPQDLIQIPRGGTLGEKTAGAKPKNRHLGHSVSPYTGVG